MKTILILLTLLFITSCGAMVKIEAKYEKDRRVSSYKLWQHRLDNCITLEKDGHEYMLISAYHATQVIHKGGCKGCIK